MENQKKLVGDGLKSEKQNIHYLSDLTLGKIGS